MQVIAVGKQHSDELSDRASTASVNNSETRALLSSQASRPDTDEETQKPSCDQEAPWYRKPQQECFRCSIIHLQSVDIPISEPVLILSFWYRLVKLGVPLSAQAILSFSATLVSMSFIGHIGKHELSAAVLGTSLFNVTGLSILIGLCSAMETLSGQVCAPHCCCYMSLWPARITCNNCTYHMLALH